ncbi:MAG: dephospho-CoA kinase [Verrucomicrobia bacterium]|nr:dephospho-CoA kinase [Verrucomicrobiota bacterium]MCH8510326.1 dephospho-CoA kinase [Kiritimatiellia bacterium]
MQCIGLTGGIAAGKSEVGKILVSQGIPVLDTDKVAHEVMEPGTTVYEQVVREFGEEILETSGEINRSKLGRLVFSDPASLLRLNAIVHPEVGRRWRAWVRDQKIQAKGPLVVVAIPLLFECGLEKEFDGVLCVWAPEELMKTRLYNRGLDDKQAKLRIQSQWPVDQKAQHSTWILKNDRDLNHLHAQVKDWLRRFNL